MSARSRRFFDYQSKNRSRITIVVERLAIRQFETELARAPRRFAVYRGAIKLPARPLAADDIGTGRFLMGVLTRYANRSDCLTRR